jgi:antitoxin component of MazEF toxin-antitoxin module
MENLHLHIGDDVNISIADGKVIIKLITNTDSHFSFHVKIDAENLEGLIMTEQIKSSFRY